MRNRTTRATVNIWLAAGVLLIGCATKDKDPIDDMKALIPKVERHLNRRDMGGLKSLGVSNFEPNSMIIDVFGDRAGDSVTLSLKRVTQEADQATLVLDMTSRQRPDERRELQLYIAQDGKWRICSYDIVSQPADSVGAGSL